MNNKEMKVIVTKGLSQCQNVTQHLEEIQDMISQVIAQMKEKQKEMKKLIKDK